MPEKRQLTGGRGVARLRHAARLRSVIALWLPVQPGGAARLRHAARLRSVIALWLLVQVGGAATFKFATVLSDHAVLQRDVAAPVWGFGEPGQQVRVALDGREVGSATVDAEGRWLVRLPPQKASASPHELTAICGGQTLRVRDVLFGEVWFGCGQSNMAYTFNGYGREPVGGRAFVATASNRLIRTLQMNVPGNANAGFPRMDAAEGVRWRVSDPADPDSVRNFSAALYWFGDKLQHSLDVPVGLINASWGATKIDGWIDADFCRAHADGYARGVGNHWYGLRAQFIANGGVEGYEKAIREWNTIFNPGANELPNSPGRDSGKPSLFDVDFDDSHWAAVTLPGTGFQHAPFPENFSGEVWLRTVIELQAEDLRKYAMSYMVRDCYGSDMVYVNGHAIGGSGNPWHGYGFPEDKCRPGKNVIAIRLKVWGRDEKTGREGGMHSAPVLKLDGGKRQMELTAWRAAVAQRAPRPYVDVAPVDARAVNMFTATSMHNGLVQPLYPMAIRGAIWYQGCSDLGNGRYANLFNALVSGWRANFTCPEKTLPVIVTEIAPHKLDSKPNSVERIAQGETARPTWSVSADMRYQLNALAETVPGCFDVSLVDLGEEDIHPVRKEEVGDRWARQALASVYGRKLTPAGPVPVSVEWKGPKAIIHYRNAAALKTSDGLPVKGFELAGPAQPGPNSTDPAKAKTVEGYCFRYADAQIRGNTVEVTAPGITEACALRYAWYDLNLGWNLVNADGLPAGVFRAFKGQEKVFVESETDRKPQIWLED